MATAMTDDRFIDETKVEEFVGKALADVSGFTTTILAFVGDRLGLFKALAETGPVTSAELAVHADISERYGREWLGAMTTAGYVEYDSASRTYCLPDAHVPALAQEAGPVFFGGLYQTLMGYSRPLDLLLEAFRKGGGIPQSAYPEDVWEGMERFTRSWYDNFLVQEWLPAMPDVKAKLERGIKVADVGAGRGRALTRLAESFPRSTFVGYDVFGPNVERARANAEAAGLADRVRFEVLDVAKGIPQKFGVITTIDVIHDAADPLGVLRSIREALTPDGVYVCLEINSSEKLEDNVGPLGALFYGASVLYCMTTSLADGGEGLGTVGVHEHKLHELGSKAGFGSINRVPLENPFNVLYELRR